MPKIIAISGEIGWDVWPEDIRRQINDAKGEDIEFQISSPGGYIYDGLEIFNLIRGYKGETTTVVVGMAASMASYLLMAGDIKKAMDNAIFMRHNARVFSGGDQHSHAKVVNILTGMSNLLAEAYIKQTGETPENAKLSMNNEDYYFGNQILEAGFVDEMINADGDEKTEPTTAIANASLKVAAVMEKVKSKPEDIDRIAAVLKPKNSVSEKAPKAGAEVSKPRQSANNLNKEKENTMTLEEFLASQEGKAALAKARSEGKEEGRTEKQNEINRIHPLISAEGASKALIESGFKALKGESSVDSFVAIADYETRKAEEDKAKATEKEQKPDVNPEASKRSKDGVIRNEEDEAAAIAEMKKG